MISFEPYSLSRCLLLLAWMVSASAAADMNDLSLEQLLDFEAVPQQVVGASRITQRASEAPSAITVLSSEEIRAYGWRTLAEALASVRGFQTTNGREYDYVAVRGFSTPGDYNSRLLLLIDGIRSNGSIYDQAYVGEEFPLDLDLIERIEIVRGPASMVYGGNAFFGAINVVTKAGKAFDGVEIAASTGSYATHTARASYGRQLENGADLLLSASGMNSAGQALYFPELGQASPGTDDANTRRLFARYRKGELQFTALWGQREHGRPSGAFGSVFDDPRNRDWDETLLLDARYQSLLTREAKISTRLFYGQSEWRGQYVNDYSGAPFDLDREKAIGRWWGLDGQLHYNGFAGHRLLLGLDYQNNTRQDQFAEDAPPSLRCTATDSAVDPCLEDRRDSERLGLYVQDNLSLSDGLLLSLGLRHDQATAADGQWSPRLGLIWRPNQNNTVKLLYGGAFRSANAYERYYSYPGTGAQIGNLGLKAETIQTFEAVWERYLGADLRMTAGVNVNQVENWIVQVDTGTSLQYQNQPEIRSHGIELELEKSFAHGASLRASYSGQFTPELPNGVINSPSRHLLKANFATPLPFANWHLGLEARYASGQSIPSGHTSAYAIANANLRWRPNGGDRTEWALGVYNAFDKNYAHSYPDDSLYSGIPRESLVQDGRSWRLKMTHRF
ncbi:MAG: TonB-dependent receptor [Pseudomonadota bacterium]|nr:TonB-dependent receptor [Pseudomonadota bacterium]MDP1903602.1 TonB-dependent receptor [Pseudomonadota bacterium]MDP2353930.1 TonB-dependent receptor [Pseudomonadota bacterium]